MSNQISAARNYDPLDATVIRLGLPGGDAFLMENLDFMRETYGDEITNAFRKAYAENDLKEAEKFASLLVDDFQFNVSRDDDKVLEIQYSAADRSSGTLSMIRKNFDEGCNLTVLAVLAASKGIHSRLRYASADQTSGLTR
jgi:hypothetical protein